jgi:hypothetical protein
MNNVNLANMNAMGGPVGGAPMAMAMNNGTMPGQQRIEMSTSRTVLNTYIYDYFLREGMYECARGMLGSDQPINVMKESPGRRGEENRDAMGNGVGDDPMDTDRKDDIDSKRPSDLPAPNLPATSDSCFLLDWFALFWDMMRAHQQKTGISNPQVVQYMNHTQVRPLARRYAQLRNFSDAIAAAIAVKAVSATGNVTADAT